MSSVIIETRHGVSFVEDKKHREKKIKIFIVKEQPYSVEKDVFPTPRQLVSHFLKGGK